MLIIEIIQGHSEKIKIKLKLKTFFLSSRENHYQSFHLLGALEVKFLNIMLKIV